MGTSGVVEPQGGRTVRVGARELFVVEFGEGPPLVMLHGGGPGASGLSNFSRNLPALARRFRLIVPDLPGYGRSTKGLDRKDPFGDLAGAILGLLDALGVARAHVLGNSLGGACALRLALEAPARVDRLVLLGPGGIDTSRRPPTQGLLHLLDYYSGEGPTRAKFEQFLRDDLVFDGAAVPDELIAARYAASLDPEVVANPPLVRPKDLPDPGVLDLTLDPRLGGLEAPTLILWGVEDRVNPPSGGPSLQARMPNCDLTLFSRTGHWVQWERSAEFNAATIAHLSLSTLA
ncbi:4,5:9,10-diseco-3-hydroxy-5,9,17-trioxoandrosta-1(10),2-diene-4-oate hydrolase [Roseiarcus fermentans]|uniref:4,5:9,10-diseco-3-hydroxy-5,9, 17-trioxoandrosta-1(10),2-diene-4-oate hydrolase n=1 Tax=Roseiarcus fermentans TaxID=1473586 RepID=A0A366FJB1_9HYPH|nr:alpha/beta fold hydrolase [Roseiarcus fermentans]RBP14070.1 4,5:9,10-diseco-3-hydroxy-5,9,17-trioxoandrosta-1(10),2-diene-4-oate hydrolase [Roseiarcus fermentans]